MSPFGLPQWSFISYFLFLCCFGAALSLFIHSFTHSFIRCSHHTDSLHCILPLPIVHRPSARLPTHYARKAITPSSDFNFFSVTFLPFSLFFILRVRRTKNTSPPLASQFQNGTLTNAAHRHETGKRMVLPELARLLTAFTNCLSSPSCSMVFQLHSVFGLHLSSCPTPATNSTWHALCFLGTGTICHHLSPNPITIASIVFWISQPPTERLQSIGSRGLLC